jgi:hypothetical protein
MTDLVTIDWLDDQKKTVLITYHRDGWSWDDFYRVLKQQYDLIDTVSHTVDVIVDVHNSHWMPRGGSLLSGIRKAENPHPRQGVTVIVGATGMVAAIAQTAMKLVSSKRKFHFAATIDEARAILQHMPRPETANTD